MIKVNLAALTVEEISELISREGYDHSHAVAIANAVYKKRITDLSLITKIPVKLRRILQDISAALIYKPVKSEISSDGSVKHLFRNDDGLLFETVLIPDRTRNTVCVSTQSGCRMGCPFCLTAKYGFHGNLSTGDIISQVIGIPGGETVTHVVFMGMGEPLDNYVNVIKACRILTAEWGLALSPGNITVSTVGITNGVLPYLEESGSNLTLSLFSPFPEERIRIIPAEKKFPALQIVDIMKNFPVKKKRRLSIAYIMLSGVNDTDRHLNGLKALLGGSGIRVNLLPYHQVPEDRYRSSSNERMMYFKHNLVISGISASIRRSRGSDIDAACGLLASGLAE